ncbi:MAG TPA: hypothetical protein VFT39_20610 [Vicinamibacterales bacterium]|nr:hypothetical protein [Vicinamibacterales bacterium]
MERRSRVALVTGANRGLGFETSRQFLISESDDVLSIPTDAYRRTFDTKAFGVIDVYRAFVPEMVQRRYGASSTYRQAPASSRGCRRTRRRTRCAPLCPMMDPAAGSFHDRRAIQW